MSDFGPRIFHSAAKYADANRDCSFVTETYPPRAGLSVIDAYNGKLTATNMECIKNGIFKLFLSRARNILHLDGYTCKKDKYVEVTVTLKFRNESFHSPSPTNEAPETKFAEPESKAAQPLEMALAENISVVGHDYDHLFDTGDVVYALTQQSAACGPRDIMDKANADDDVYNNQLTW